MSAILAFVLAFVFTIFVECGLAMLFKEKGLVKTMFLCNLLTNPSMNFILLLVNMFADSFYFYAVAILEICVVIIEMFLIKAMQQYSIKKAFLFSLLFNVYSLLLGIALWFMPIGGLINSI